MSKEEARTVVQILCFYRVHHQTHNPPKKTRHQMERKSALVDLTVPPELTEIESRNENHKKLSLIQPSDKLEENLD